ncbi:PKD domain-containing protein [Arthrobacter sp. TMN-49]
MHTPCLSVGQYVCASGAPIANLLLSKNVHLVLNGHEHVYQRTKQLATSGTCTGLVSDVYTAACVADVDNSLGKGAGTVFTTVGTGGVTLRDVNAADPEAPYLAASSGLNAAPSHGLLDLRFTATTMSAGFIATSGTFQDGFSIAPTGANVPPTAAFTSSCVALACTFNGAGSNDPGGSIVSYAWDFGDSTTSTNQPASRTYLAPGTYPVTLTVTDDAGSTGTVVHNVSVTDPVVGLLAQDIFERTVTNGLGAAATGGTWTTTGSAANYSVAAGTGRVRIPAAGGGLNSYLGSVASSNTELYLELATDKAATGSNIYLSGIGRRIAGAGEYRAKLSLATNGSVALSLVRTAANGAKVWELGSAEPTNWQRSITDATAALQGTGGLGLATYLSSTANNAPLTVSMDNLRAITP